MANFHPQAWVLLFWSSAHWEMRWRSPSTPVIYYQMSFCTKRFIQASDSVIGSRCKGSVDIRKLEESIYSAQGVPCLFHFGFPSNLTEEHALRVGLPRNLLSSYPTVAAETWSLLGTYALRWPWIHCSSWSALNQSIWSAQQLYKQSQWYDRWGK